MVFDATDSVERAFLTAHDTALEGIEPFGNAGGDPRGSALSREHNVEQEL
jgi:hypothetical protein